MKRKKTKEPKIWPGWAKEKKRNIKFIPVDLVFYLVNKQNDIHGYSELRIIALMMEGTWFEGVIALTQHGVLTITGEDFDCFQESYSLTPTVRGLKNEY